MSRFDMYKEVYHFCDFFRCVDNGNNCCWNSDEDYNTCPYNVLERQYLDYENTNKPPKEAPLNIEKIKTYTKKGNCPNCRETVFDTMNYCPECGFPLFWPEEQEAED